MPGANCVLPGCGVSRHSNFKGVGIFQISRRESNKEWRTNLLGVISKYRSIDKYLKERIDSGNIYICERHFLPEDIEFTSEFILLLFCIMRMQFYIPECYYVFCYFHHQLHEVISDSVKYFSVLSGHQFKII